MFTLLMPLTTPIINLSDNRDTIIVKVHNLYRSNQPYTGEISHAERASMTDDYNEVHYMEGMSAFQSARMHAFWDEMMSLIRGKSAELLSFEDIRTRLRLREENYQGLQDVPLHKIAGSVGRYREFTSNFLPKKSIGQERWSRVYAQASGMTGLPP